MVLRRIGAADRTQKISTLQSSYQNLAEAASALNQESDKFSSVIVALDEALNNLSPGVASWITFSSESDDQGLKYEERLGFAKTGNRWGLTLCRATINPHDNDSEKVDVWFFNDAPRSLRLRAIDFVPDLIDELAKQTQHLAKEVSAGAEVAFEMLRSVNAAVAAKEKQR